MKKTSVKILACCVIKPYAGLNRIFLTNKYILYIYRFHKSMAYLRIIYRYQTVKSSNFHIAQTVCLLKICFLKKNFEDKTFNYVSV